MATDFTITQNPADGTTLIFTDTSNVTFSDVKAVRFYFGSFDGDQAAASNERTDGDALIQWTEYQKTSLAASVYDLKTIAITQRYIPFITGLTVLPGDTFIQTGRTSKFVAPATYLPTANYTPYFLSPQDLLYPSDVTVFPAGINYLQYEQYGDSIPNPLVNMVEGEKYLVEGTGTCVYNGSTYRTGEQIVGLDTNPVSFTGSATLRLMIGVKFQYFLTDFEIVRDLHNLEYRAVSNCGYDCDWQKEIWSIRMKLNFIRDSIVMNRTSATLCNTLLQNIQTEIARLNNCIPQAA